MATAATVLEPEFPLGMYAVAGTYLGRADELPLVRQVGAVMIWAAFAVRVVTFGGEAIAARRWSARAAP